MGSQEEEGSLGLPLVFLSCGCCNEVPQSGWLKAADIYLLPVLRPEVWVWQGCAPPGGAGEGPACPSQLRWCQQSWARGHITPVSVLSSHGISLCLISPLPSASLL